MSEMSIEGKEKSSINTVLNETGKKEMECIGIGYMYQNIGKGSKREEKL